MPKGILVIWERPVKINNVICINNINCDDIEINDLLENIKILLKYIITQKVKNKILKININQQMNINFTKEQFEILLKLVYLGNWVANANRDGSRENPYKEEYKEKYEAIEDYIFSYAKQFGFDEYVDDEKAEKGKFYPTRMFEEETDIQKLIEEYDEEIFWDELIDRLGNRDFYRYYSKDEIQKMTQNERFEKVYEFIDKWTNEISENGIERLRIK